MCAHVWSVNKSAIVQMDVGTRWYRSARSPAGYTLVRVEDEVLRAQDALRAVAHAGPPDPEPGIAGPRGPPRAPVAPARQEPLTFLL